MTSYLERDMATVAREIIGLYYANQKDVDIVEYLSRICFSLARVFDELSPENKTVNWDDLFSFFDQKYYSMKNNTTPPNSEKIDVIYQSVSSMTS